MELVGTGVRQTDIKISISLLSEFHGQTEPDSQMGHFLLLPKLRPWNIPSWESLVHRQADTCLHGCQGNCCVMTVKVRKGRLRQMGLHTCLQETQGCFPQRNRRGDNARSWGNRIPKMKEERGRGRVGHPNTLHVSGAQVSSWKGEDRGTKCPLKETKKLAFQHCVSKPGWPSCRDTLSLRRLLEAI